MRGKGVPEYNARIHEGVPLVDSGNRWVGTGIPDARNLKTKHQQKGTIICSLIRADMHQAPISRTSSKFVKCEQQSFKLGESHP